MSVDTPESPAKLDVPLELNDEHPSAPTMPAPPEGEMLVKWAFTFMNTYYSPGHKVGRFTLSRISPFRLGIGDLGRCKMEKQLQCGTFGPLAMSESPE